MLSLGRFVAVILFSLLFASPVMAARIFSDNAWSPSFGVAGLESAPVYLTITNLSDTNRYLVGASTESASQVTIQSLSQSTNRMRISYIDRVELPIAVPVNFENSALFLMLEGIKNPLRAGSRFNLTLHFDNGEQETVRVQVRSVAVSGDRMLENMRTDPMQPGRSPRRTEGLDEGIMTDPLIR
ncbi:MAG: copper chaperone PCu(A)C [Nitrincola sp.]|nr:copper chaperone PCu(A)C [Nitrincola sp.]